MSQNKLLLEKTIYAKRKPFSAEQVNEVLKLEVQTHITNNPELVFLKLGEVRSNADRSKTFPLMFVTKESVEKTRKEIAKTVADGRP